MGGLIHPQERFRKDVCHQEVYESSGNLLALVFCRAGW